jgi:hypothetical protein
MKLASFLLICATLVPTQLETLLAAADNTVVVPAKIEDRSPREDLRLKIFANDVAQRACRVMSKDPKGSVDADARVSLFIHQLLKAINSSDAKQLRSMFHPQLKVTLNQATSSLTSIKRISGERPEATLLRAYGINSLDGTTSAIPCQEDSLEVYPLSAHPFQIGLWIQATGADEITRIYAQLVPSKERWFIGAWHVQQWTHAGKEVTVWVQEAEGLLTKNQQLASWIYLDIASKLLDGGKFLRFPVMDDVTAEKKKVLGTKTLKDALSPKFKDDKLVYTSSLFSRKGASLLLRFSIPAEWSAVAIREHCRQKFKQLSVESWMSAIAGVRCDYVLPRESIEKEGVLGGVFVDAASLSQK